MVAFGTAVENDYANVTSQAYALSGVQDGQPIVLVVSFIGVFDTGITISDSFPTSYSWALAVSQAGTSGHGVLMFVGSGGHGTSGTVTVHCSSGDYPGGVAIPCIGASVAGAIDLSMSQGPSPSIWPTLSPPEGEGMIAAAGGGGPISVFPGSPWVDTSVSFSGSVYSGVASYDNTPGSSLTAAWNGSPSWVAALSMKPIASAPTKYLSGQFGGGNWGSRNFGGGWSY